MVEGAAEGWRLESSVGPVIWSEKTELTKSEKNKKVKIRNVLENF